MATRIRLKRMGRKFYAFYRIVVVDQRAKRDGRVIEEVGTYDPNTQPSTIHVKSDRIQHWLSVGAQPSDPVLVLLKITGDWQKAKGLPGAEGTLKVAEEKPSKLELFNAALAEANNGPSVEAVSEKRAKAKEEKEAKAAAELAAEEAAKAAEEESAE